jgi:hypothetical protein
MSDTYVGKFAVEGTGEIVHVYVSEGPRPIHRPLAGPATEGDGALHFFTEDGRAVNVTKEYAELADTHQRIYQLDT